MTPMKTRRTRTVSAKVTEQQYEALIALAGDEGLSEWVRRVLLSTAAPSATDQLVFAELLALRTILVNLQFSVATGEPLTIANVQRLIDRVDDEKLQKARELLAAAMRSRL
jgi:hypothetical protein